MGAQSRWTSIATFPFDVSKTAWNTSGVFSVFGAGFRAASFLLSSGDEHPPSARLTAALTASHQLFRIVPQYAMLAFGALRRFRLVLQSLLERGVSWARLPHTGAHLAAAGGAEGAGFGCLLRHRLPGRTAGRPRIPRHRHRRLRGNDRARVMSISGPTK